VHSRCGRRMREHCAEPRRGRAGGRAGGTQGAVRCAGEGMASDTRPRAAQGQRTENTLAGTALRARAQWAEEWRRSSPLHVTRRVVRTALGGRPQCLPTVP
jgi:hypothetical protein